MEVIEIPKKKNEGKKAMPYCTPNQEKFARLIAEGSSQVDAYKKAYNSKASLDNLYSKASKTAKIPKVRKRIDDLNKRFGDQAFWTKNQMLAQLKKIADEAINAEIKTVTRNKRGTDEEEVTTQIDSFARSIAVKAISEAAKLCGFEKNDQEPSDVEVRIDSAGKGFAA